MNVFGYNETLILVQATTVLIIIITEVAECMNLSLGTSKLQKALIKQTIVTGYNKRRQFHVPVWGIRVI